MHRSHKWERKRGQRPKAQLDSLTAQTAKAKADYAGIVKDLETLADITEIAAKVYRTKIKTVEHKKKQEQPQQKWKNKQSL